MAANRWIFTFDSLSNTPSRKCGIDSEKESNYRQQAASLIQDMGQKLQVTQLCINTAIVYMHRFYMFHSFSKFNRTSLAGACLFLAAKVEEQPRKLEHVIRTGYMCTHRDQPQLDIKSDSYLELAQELVIDENILLQTLGFEITVDHPHTHIVKTCNLVRASKDLAQTSYFLATNSLHLTSMCLQYPPTIVACVCIHLACKWSSFEIPQSSEGKAWYYYVDTSVTSTLLEDITQDFLAVLEKCPSKMRKKLTNHKTSLDDFNQNYADRKQTDKNATDDAKDKVSAEDMSNNSNGNKLRHTNNNRMSSQASVSLLTSSQLLQCAEEKEVTGVNTSSAVSRSETTIVQTKIDSVGSMLISKESLPNQLSTLRRVKTESSTLTTKEYFERKERERLEREASKLESRLLQSEAHMPLDRLLTRPTEMQPEILESSHRPAVTIQSQTSANNSPKWSHRLKISASPTKGSLGMGDPSDHRPANIFDCFHLAPNSQSNNDAKHKSLNELDPCTDIKSDNNDTMQSRPTGSLHTDRPPLEVNKGTSRSVAADTMMGQSLGTTVYFDDQARDDYPLSHIDAQLASPNKPLHQPASGEPLNVSTNPSKSYEQRSSRRKLVSETSKPSPLKLKLSIPDTVSHVESHRTDINELPSVWHKIPDACTESQERIRLKLNLTGGKVEKLTDSAVASPSSCGVKLVLSKDKVSGEYQPGISGRHQSHHHHSHRHVHSHHHKHSRADTSCTDNSGSHKRAAVAVSHTLSNAPPLKILRTDSSLVGNGNRTGTASIALPCYQHHQSDIAVKHIPSTYRLPPPPPPPPLPIDEPSVPPPPPML